jgi:hypothetical protein
MLASAVTRSLLWFALFFGWIALLIFTIYHCVKRWRPPVWAMVALGIPVIVFPFLGVGLYWLIYFVAEYVRRGQPRSDLDAT